MAIRRRSIVWSAALVGVTTLVTGHVVSQQDAGKAQDPAEMMREWMKLAQPGAQHAEMATWAGTWKQETTHWMYPGAEGTTSTGTATLEPILGGRFLLEKAKGTIVFGGEKVDFEGLGIFGYDNIRKKYTFAWADNMGTLIMTGEGTADETGKTITYFSTLPNPMTGGTMEIKSVSRIESENRHVMDMHEKMPDGSWFLNMRVVATR